MDAISSATSGLLAASQRFDAATLNTVRDANTGDMGNLAADAVDQMQSRAAFSASVSVMKTTDKMMGQLLDITA